MSKVAFGVVSIGSQEFVCNVEYIYKHDEGYLVSRVLSVGLKNKDKISMNIADYLSEEIINRIKERFNNERDYYC